MNSRSIFTGSQKHAHGSVGETRKRLKIYKGNCRSNKTREVAPLTRDPVTSYQRYCNSILLLPTLVAENEITVIICLIYRS